MATSIVLDVRRYQAAVGLSATLGLCAVLALHGALTFRMNSEKPTPPARISVRAAPAPTPVSKAPPVAPAPPANSKILPLPTEKTTSAEKSTPKHTVDTAKAVPPATPASAPTEEKPSPAVEPPVALELPTLEQPALGVPSNAPRVQELPPLATSEVPPMPGARPSLPNFALAAVEKPGGPILVLGVQVNEQGIVEDVVIVVPSKYPMADLTLAFGYRGQKWTELDPPLMPGEHRWLELRVDHSAKRKRDDILP